MSDHFRSSPASRPPLRIGVLLDGPVLPRAFARVLEDIRASNFARLELLVFRKAAGTAEPEQRPRTPVARMARRLFDPGLRKGLLYDLYLRLDERLKPANDPLEPVDCSDLLAGVESLEVEPIGRKFVHRFPEEALAAIRSKDLDVLLRFGFNILHGGILAAARYGVWSYHHGDNEYYRGGPPHFWEIRERAPLSGVVLQVLTESLDDGLVLSKSLFATEPTISVSKNRFAPYWGAADMVIRKLRELHAFGWDSLRQRSVPPVTYKGRRKIYKAPTNADMIRWLVPVALKKAARSVWRPHAVQHWKIAIRFGGRFDSGSGDDLAGFRWLEPPPGRFWADPFLLERDGRRWLYFEEFSYAASRAWISCAEVGADGTLLAPVRCLDDGVHHFSFPHVFTSGEDLFMIPEAFDSNTIDLYRCVEFPGRWTKEATLMEGQFVDTVVWRHDGLWWLMTTSASPDPRAASLLLFYSDSLTGGWRLHPANPISTDVRNNRGAGKVFRSGDRWIRPSQSCTPCYGYSFTLNEITDLSTERYGERPLKTIRPENGFCGVHTYNRAGDVEVIDGATMAALRRVMQPAG